MPSNVKQDKHKIIKSKVQERHKIYSDSTTYAFVHSPKQKTPLSYALKIHYQILFHHLRRNFVQMVDTSHFIKLLLITSKGFSFQRDDHSIQTQKWNSLD